MVNPVVDKNKCIGCGTCVAIAPSTFEIGADGKAQVKTQVGDDPATINNAVSSCPVQAISLGEDQPAASADPSTGEATDQVNS